MTEKEFQEFVREQQNLMKPSTLAFMKKQPAKNKARMEREARGDYGIPIFIVP
ncbi:hypothetical protein LCGC14_2940910 [marine sediment metagenome]|uniref:Uncharacterized protein n=1 Tax=marine sediment metagenome TaxID=412755 RepID=A0A0F8XHZ2_9ZZZZ